MIVAWAAACQPVKQRFPPLTRDPSVGFLRAEVDTASAALAAALEGLPPKAGQSQAAIERAEQTLGRLSGYYLPVFEARQRAYNAYELASVDRMQAARSELDAVEKILLAVAQAESDHIARELQEPLDLLEEARLALASDSGTGEHLAALAEYLSLMLLKGRLASG